jgi:exodeoxyribonuclease V alpha subunit
VSPARLPEHETAFAMTVHKSQGSEFDEVIVVLPESQSLIMTRELLYTAITRAKKKVIIAADLKTIKEMSQRPMERMTGLRDRLWNL